MRRLLIVLLLALSGTLHAQQAQQTPERPPTPAEIAFARLPADIQQMLAGMTADEAMQKVAQARQQAIALGIPNPTAEQFRTTLAAVLGGSAYTSASAGATTFPPLSPLVPPPPPPFLR